MDTVDMGQEQGLGSYGGFFIALYQLLIMLVLPLLLMIVCYSRVIKELWLSTKQITAMTRECSRANSTRRGFHEAQPGWESASPSLNTISARVGSRPATHHLHSMQMNASQSVHFKASNKCSSHHSRSGDGAKQARKQVQSVRRAIRSS